MSRVRVLCGGGRYGDPWHDFKGTSEAIASVVEGLGLSVEVVGDEPHSLSDLHGVDLLIVNAGGGHGEMPPHDPAWMNAHQDLAYWMASGGAVLAVHAAYATFPEWPEWPRMIGGRFATHDLARFEGVGTFLAMPGAHNHPVLASLPSVIARESRTAFLETYPGSEPLLAMVHEEAIMPVVWVRGQRLIYDGLGHDVESYRSATRRALLGNEVMWLLHQAWRG